MFDVANDAEIASLPGAALWPQLHQASTQLGVAQDPTQVFRALLEPAQAALGAHAATAFSVQNTQLKPVLTLPEQPARAVAGLAAEALRQRRFLLDSAAGGAVAVMPLLTPAVLEPLAVLMLEFSAPHVFSADEEHFLQLLALQGAAALERLRLHARQDALLHETRSAEARFRRMVEAAPTPVAVGGEDGSLLVVNDAYLRVLGYTRQEFEQGHMDWLALTPPAYRGQDSEMFALASQHGQSPPYRKEMMTKAGEVRQLRVQLLRHTEDAQHLVVGYVEDLTDHLAVQAHNAHLAGQLQAGEQEREHQSRALEAFVAFTEAVGSETGLSALARQAVSVLRASLGDVSVVYFQQEQGGQAQGGGWQARAWSEDLSAGVLSVLHADLAARLPRLEDTLVGSGLDFAEGEIGHVARSLGYGAVALYPYLHGGRVVAVLVLGRKAAAWPTWDRAVVRAVGRGLELALERARHADQLQERAQALAAANEELASFNHSVSHDLMTPVRHVQGFARLARQHQHDAVKTQRYLELVEDGAQRTLDLIQAMLQLSESGRQPLNRGPVPLADLVQQAQLDVQCSVPDARVEWRVGPPVTVWGDRVTLQQVMSNLVTNAVKYSRGAAPAVIEVWGEEAGPGWTVHVRDNGVGFDPRQGKRLFRLFQRLSPQDQPGTGVGLAIVRRVVSRHGGQVWAHGQPGEGATFSFTLPRP